MSTIKEIVYLDHNATTPLDPQVFEAMKPYFLENFGNAASIDHKYGYKASLAVDSARNDIASVIDAHSNEMIFTSGATESDNLAILGVMEQYQNKGDHMITCVTEHEAVLRTAKYLEEKKNKKITYLPVDHLGHINYDDLQDAITDKTILISIMTANNEIGTIHDVARIGKIAHDNEVLFHTDAAQAVGHIPMNVKSMNIDLMSFSAHKMYGPKGIGALYIRGNKPRVSISGIIHGGGQERGVRPGTLNVPAIVGFAKAVSITSSTMDKDQLRIKKQSDKMLGILMDSGALLNGDTKHRLGGNINVCYPRTDGKAIINTISDDVAISAGSACTTQNVKPSHVIMALGYGEDRAHSSIRIGLGRYTTEVDSEHAAHKITDAVKIISRMSDGDGNDDK